MGFNLRSIKTHESFTVEIKDPEGNETGVVFTLASPTHPVRKALDQEVRDKLIAEYSKRGKFAPPKSKDEDKDRATALAKRTLGWEGYEESGVPVPFSTEAAAALYADPEMKWLADQVDEALGNAQLYTKTASRN